MYFSKAAKMDMLTVVGIDESLRWRSQTVEYKYQGFPLSVIWTPIIKPIWQDVEVLIKHLQGIAFAWKAYDENRPERGWSCPSLQQKLSVNDKCMSSKVAPKLVYFNFFEACFAFKK